MLSGGPPGAVADAVPAGTRESFEACYAACFDDALKYARTLTRDRQQAEDAVAEAFTKIYRRWHLAGIHQPRAYVRRAVANEVVSGFRRRGRERALLHQVETDTTVGEAGDGVCDRDAVVLLVATLPPRQRAAVTLRYLVDLSEAEVARRMGTSVGAVKSNTARGLVALRAAAAGATATASAPVAAPVA
jgi:RNA polymerase sigma-70 factor (sigma-E family)